jgi:hypothetical protein
MKHWFYYILAAAAIALVITLLTAPRPRAAERHEHLPRYPLQLFTVIT